ncbi:hypothetical protein [Amycolatopsis sp. NPDC051071]|uniref:hypothetical protein n=1 Tax=Amycolatopsis sp. NPDC051071 TaxID=3154637 RepID=UPI00341BC53C
MAAGALDPLTLADDVERLVATGIAAQARALALARQENAASFVPDEVLAARIQDAQEQVGESTAYFLDRLLPDLIRGLSDADGAAGLVTGLDRTITRLDTDGQVPVVTGAVVTEFDAYRAKSLRLSNALTAAAGRADAKVATLAGVLKSEIAALDGPDGAIAKARAGIAATVKALDDDVNAVVTQAKAVGSGVKGFLTDKVKFATGILTDFGGKDTTPPKAGEKPKDTGKKFSVTGIDVERAGDTGADTASSGATGLDAAIAAFKRDNVELAALYQRLYRLNAAMAVAAALTDQITAYAGALRLTAVAAANVTTTWETCLARTDGALDTRPSVEAALAKVTDGWAELSARLRHARMAVAGGRGLIPDVGPLLVRTP